MIIHIVTWTVRAVSSPCRAEPSQAGPRHARCHTAALGCDVMQQGSKVRNVTGCYATLDKQSLSALGSDVTYTSQLHSTQRCYGHESTVLGYHVTPCVAMVKTVY
jgi:hypothetical protein